MKQAMIDSVKDALILSFRSDMKMKLYGIDIETHDPHLTDKGASWVYGEGEVIVTGLYNASTGEKTVKCGNGGRFVKNLLLNPEAALVGANIVYDIGWLCYEHKLSAKEVRCGLVDVSMAEQCIDEYQAFSLDALAWKYLHEKKAFGKLPAIAAAKGLRGDFRQHIKALWDMGYGAEIAEYVMSDADQPVRIWKKQRQILTKKAAQGNEDFSASMDAAAVNFKLIKIVLDMKQRGVRIDMKKRRKNHELLAGIQKRLQHEFEALYGKVNFNSPKQLAELFDNANIPYRCKIRVKGYEGGEQFVGNELWEQRKKLKETFNGARIQKGQLVIYTPKQYSGRTSNDLRQLGYVITCNPNIDKKALGIVRKSHDAAKRIVDLKQVTSIIDKFMGTKFDRFIVRHGENNYRIHADFNIVGARQTGRFSSANPNLQQVPSKTVLFADTPDELKLYTLCREIIIPDEGMLMGKADYSGQENRLMAHFAVGNGADEIRRKYNEIPDLDFHKYIGEVSGLYEEYGEDVGRKYAKNCSFGLGYGMQLQTMMETFGWNREEAERITMLYHDGAPFVRATMDKVSDVIVKRGYIKTLAGRHCRLRAYNGRTDTRSAYKGFNKLIQGSAADMTKKAVVMLDEKGILDIFPLYLLVHDEIDFGIPRTEAAIRRLPEIREVMENTFPLSVPIRADPEVGVDWGHVAGRKKTKNKRTGDMKVETFNHFIERIIKKDAVNGQR
jgi:DNA polymerase I-like protein with 3'-5' exonuclease and polymerase domains